MALLCNYSESCSEVRRIPPLHRCKGRLAHWYRNVSVVLQVVVILETMPFEHTKIAQGQLRRQGSGLVSRVFSLYPVITVGLKL